MKANYFLLKDNYALLRQHVEQTDEFQLGHSQFEYYIGNHKCTINIDRLLHVALLNIKTNKFETVLVIDKSQLSFKYKIIGHKTEYVSANLKYSSLDDIFNVVFGNLQELSKPPVKLYIKSFGHQPKHILELQEALIKTNGMFQDSGKLISVIGHIFAHGVTPSNIALRVHNESPYHLYINRSTGEIHCDALNVPGLELTDMEISFEAVAKDLKPETQGCFQILELK